MAPRKEKVDKAGVDGSAMILDYLKKQKYETRLSYLPVKLTILVGSRLMRNIYSSRPYSAIDISANLHQKVTKAYAAKALKEMHDRKEIEGRVSGKQTVYHAIQDPADDASAESLAAIDKELEGIKEEIVAGKAREKALKTELTMLNSRVSTADLRQGVSNLEGERERVLIRLSTMRSSTVQPVRAEEKMRVEKEWRVWKRHVNVRKRICKELWERCTEVLPEDTTKADLWPFFNQIYLLPSFIRRETLAVMG
ncbi:hypothetical protein FQN54_004270, partial [Arachnomyces sp. PD_36]